MEVKSRLILLGSRQGWIQGSKRCVMEEPLPLPDRQILSMWSVGFTLFKLRDSGESLFWEPRFQRSLCLDVGHWSNSLPVAGVSEKLGCTGKGQLTEPQGWVHHHQEEFCSQQTGQRMLGRQEEHSQPQRVVRCLTSHSICHRLTGMHAFCFSLTPAPWANRTPWGDSGALWSHKFLETPSYSSQLSRGLNVDSCFVPRDLELWQNSLSTRSAEWRVEWQYFPGSIKWMQPPGHLGSGCRWSLTLGGSRWKSCDFTPLTCWPAILSYWYRFISSVLPMCCVWASVQQNIILSPS